MKADLHSHSIYSDGKYTVEELIKRAKEKGIDVLALTDHDTVLGDDELDKYGSMYNVKVIKGIELSCKYYGEMIHVVGLFKWNNVPKYMYDLSIELEEKRKKRAIEMALKIKDIYHLNIYVDKLLEENKLITRKNILDHIMKYNDMDYESASFYVSRKSLAYISSEKYEVSEGIKILHDNNAICILAHPCLIKREESKEELAKLPFDGIEAKYANKCNDYEFFSNLAKKYNF